MALLQKLKEKLGFGSGSGEREAGETEVTVERESEPAAEPPAADEPAAGDSVEPDDAEQAESESSDAEPAESGADDGVEEAVAAETEAAASTESLVDDEGAGADEAAEQAEAAAGEADDVAVDDDDRGPSVEEIKGIGPAYAERLAEIGIETVSDLADADAAEVAEGTSVGEKRAATWIDRAGEF
ncbi:helix-hairpin-helix domain-containing protein [Halorubrum sp. SS5]|nr:helix-hairpin-helix domain-containing protein [Halorubrum sp. SS5]